VTPVDAIDLALARAVLYGALARVFSYSDAGDRGSLMDPSGRETLLTAGRLLDPERDDTTNLTESLERVFGARSLEDPHAFATEFERLFGHTARGVVCPYETEYGAEGLFRQPQQLAEIGGYYRAFGLRPCAEERPDHVACECDFMGFLALKEAHLREELRLGPPDPDACGQTLDETCRAGHRFLRDHLARFGSAFAGTLVREAEGTPFGPTGEVLGRLLALECDRAGIALGPSSLPLRADAEDDVPMACGGASESCDTPSELIQIQRRKP
jgi:TorA maturation chaperone TorD